METVSMENAAVTSAYRKPQRGLVMKQSEPDLEFPSIVGEVAKIKYDLQDFGHVKKLGIGLLKGRRRDGTPSHRACPSTYQKRTKGD